MAAWCVGLAGGVVGLSLAYLYALVAAALRVRHAGLAHTVRHRFAVAIPAHDEEANIGATIRALQRQDYPAELFTIFVVADNCSDHTSGVARAAGAVCLERTDPTNRGKGYALRWLLPQILARRPSCDAVIVFDADSVVDPRFLRVMDAMLRDGHAVIQGKHVIANPTRGWLPAVMYTAFAADNLRNLGRSNLGLSSKLMGDAMCFARGVLEAHPWDATSQTEDGEFWATLLRNGIRVAFAPDAVSRGEMVATLGAAQAQRARWMRGRAEVVRRFAVPLLAAGLRRSDWVQVDAAIELALPSYSTLFVLTGITSAVASLPIASGGLSVHWLIALWVLLIAYPLPALLLERAPAAVYFYLAGAPAYLAWRTCLRLWVSLRRGPAAWVRTPRSSEAARRPADP